MKYVIRLNGKNYEVEVEETDAVITSITDTPQAAPVAAVAAPASPAAHAASSAAPSAPVQAEDGTHILAPMAGIILSVNFAAGQAVKSGDVLLVLEAMKMENEIVSPANGTVKQVLVRKGATVDTDDVLLVIG